VATNRYLLAIFTCLWSLMVNCGYAQDDLDLWDISKGLRSCVTQGDYEFVKIKGKKRAQIVKSVPMGLLFDEIGFDSCSLNEDRLFLRGKVGSTTYDYFKAKGSPNIPIYYCTKVNAKKYILVKKIAITDEKGWFSCEFRPKSSFGILVQDEVNDLFMMRVYELIPNDN